MTSGTSGFLRHADCPQWPGMLFAMLRRVIDGGTCSATGSFFLQGSLYESSGRYVIVNLGIYCRSLQNMSFFSFDAARCGSARMHEWLLPGHATQKLRYKCRGAVVEDSGLELLGTRQFVMPNGAAA